MRVRMGTFIYLNKLVVSLRPKQCPIFVGKDTIFLNVKDGN